MNERFETFTVLINRISRNIRKIKNQEMAEYKLRSVHISCLYYLHLTNDDLKPNTGRYARICSTYRTQYYKNGGKEDVGDNDE